MKIASAIATQISGSVGGLTGSHNRGGMYFRGRAIPTNPNTPRQQAVREDVGQLSNAWNNILTDAQRAAWNLYAANVPMVNPLGASTLRSGFNHYIRSNGPRLQAGLTRIDAAPVVFNLGSTPILDNLVADPGDTYTVLGQIPSPAVITDQLLVWIGRPCSLGRTFFRGPYRFGSVTAFAVDGTAEPTGVASPYAFSLGQRVFIRARVSLTDGRLSAAAQASVIVAAP